MDRVRRISVVVPMRNEADHVEHLVADLAAQDFAGEVEVLVADGRSTDGSAELLEQAARRADLALEVLDNPSGTVSPGLNACIRQARGDLIVRLDCHSRYPPDYLRRCAVTAEETGAWNVGGLMVPTGRTWLERAIAGAMDSPFGGVGWTRHASRTTRVDADTVQLGAFRPEAFRRAGLYDESLVRNQDDELNFRIRAAGGRVVLDPGIRVLYIPRGSFPALWSQYFEYGYWKAAVTARHGRVLSLRSLVPAVFVLSLAALALAAAAQPLARRALAAELGLYAAGALVAAAASIRRRREPWSLLPLVAAAFPTAHLAYGLGTWRGALPALKRHAGPAGAEPRADLGCRGE